MEDKYGFLLSVVVSADMRDNFSISPLTLSPRKKSPELLTPNRQCCHSYFIVAAYDLGRHGKQTWRETSLIETPSYPVVPFSIHTKEQKLVYFCSSYSFSAASLLLNLYFCNYVICHTVLQLLLRRVLMPSMLLTPNGIQFLWCVII